MFCYTKPCAADLAVMSQGGPVRPPFETVINGVKLVMRMVELASQHRAAQAAETAQVEATSDVTPSPRPVIRRTHWRRPARPTTPRGPTLTPAERRIVELRLRQLRKEIAWRSSF